MLSLDNINEITSRVEACLIRYNPGRPIACMYEGVVPNHPEMLSFCVRVDEKDSSVSHFATRINKSLSPTEAIRWILGTVVDNQMRLAESDPAYIAQGKEN